MTLLEEKTEAASELASDVDLTAGIVSARVSRSSMPPAKLPDLIRSVHRSPAGGPLKPSVSTRKPVTDGFTISLEDGRKMKSMRCGLTGLGMTPNDCRAKWGLPKDRPMVAPASAAQRSALARTFGLGRKATSGAKAPAPVFQPEPAAVARPQIHNDAEAEAA